MLLLEWALFSGKGTVGSRPKIRQNYSKPAEKESDWPGKLTAVRPPILNKSGRKAAEKNSLIESGFLHEISRPF
jgi:hypothetical protein